MWEAENIQLCTKEEVVRWRYHNGNWMKEEMETTKIKVEVTWIRTRYRLNPNVLLNIESITCYTRVLKNVNCVQIKNKCDEIKDSLNELFCNSNIQLVLSYLIDNVPIVKISK
jgi:hypothetical protein